LTKWTRIWRWDAYRSGRIAWNDYDLWCIHQGGGVLHCSAGQFQLQVGDVFLFHPDDHYLADADPANPGWLFYIHFDWVDACGQPRYQVQPPRLHRRMDDFALFSSLLWRVLLAFNQQDDASVAALGYGPASSTSPAIQVITAMPPPSPKNAIARHGT
jgi:hypothetical protein